MRHIRALVACGFVLAALTVPAPAPAATALTATVGPGFNITLTKAGKKVTSLKPGKYTITVRDRSNIHNFHLIGPRVNKDSGVAATGTKTFTVKLRKGTYRYVCDPHAEAMKGRFSVR